MGVKVVVMFTSSECSSGVILYVWRSSPAIDMYHSPLKAQYLSALRSQVWTAINGCQGDDVAERIAGLNRIEMGNNDVSGQLEKLPPQRKGGA